VITRASDGRPFFWLILRRRGTAAALQVSDA